MILFMLKFLVYFHRLIGITFGGLIINSNGELTMNKLLKYYGFLIIISCLVFNTYFSFTFIMNIKLTIFSQHGFDDQLMIPIILNNVSHILMSVQQFLTILTFNTN